MARARLTPFEWACVGVTALAFALRIPFILSPHPIWDSAWYLMLSRSWLDHGDFWIRWTDPPQTSGYWPPLYPIVISPLVRTMGGSYPVLMLASTLTTALLALATLGTTWDLFGRTRAFAAMAIVSATPAFVTSNLHGMSEATLELAVVLALWAFVKSVRNKWFLPPALGFGALAYLAKPNVGAPLVALALVPVAAWRIRARGWRRVLRDPLDVGVAIAGIGALLAARLLVGKGLGGIGLDVIQPLRDAIANPLWIVLVAFKFAFAAVFLLFATLPVSLKVREVLRVPAREETGYLWIVVVLALAATAVFSASFLITEHRAPLEYGNVAAAFRQGTGPGFSELSATLASLTDFDNVRYLSPAIVPFLWIVLPAWDFDASRERAPRGTEGEALRRRHWALYAAAVVAYALLLLFSPLGVVESLTRLWVTVLLALVPLGLALAARGTQYDIAARVTAKGQRVARIVRKPAPFRMTRASAIIVLASLAAAYVFSSWFLLVTLGVLVAWGASSNGARVTAVAIFLVCATVPNYASVAPNAPAAADLARELPSGSVVGVTEPIVYFAAVAPSTLHLRAVDPSTPSAPPGMDAVLVTGPHPAFGDANFSPVQQWNYSFSLYPTLAWRVAFERAALSQSYDFRAIEGLTLYVRNGSAAAGTFGR